jgi:hypothetical protein
MDNYPEIFLDGNSPRLAWQLIAKKVMEMHGAKHRVDSLSGRESFRLNSCIVRSIIEWMETAEKWLPVRFPGDSFNFLSDGFVAARKRFEHRFSCELWAF